MDMSYLKHKVVASLKKTLDLYGITKLQRVLVVVSYSADLSVLGECSVASLQEPFCHFFTD